ncbi:hypothetical protein LOK49_LG12G02962 [Camellia lanceoleosa]|uniref:Uncharacterized protein n=1 Tax=Camellia lanceoleosa TaxID=1840588 RepID=A0ACC0FVK0_9ERIC|nr:hypothetical protein LOK49_LG12G02962 [Camellia lanceoleosa]
MRKPLEIIDKHMMYWPKFLVHKTKQRLTKMTRDLESYEETCSKNEVRISLSLLVPPPISAWLAHRHLPSSHSHPHPLPSNPSLIEFRSSPPLKIDTHPPSCTHPSLLGSPSLLQFKPIVLRFNRDSLNVTHEDQSSMKAKIKETMEKAFWDDITESMK